MSILTAAAAGDVQSGNVFNPVQKINDDDYRLMHPTEHQSSELGNINFHCQKVTITTTTLLSYTPLLIESQQELQFITCAVIRRSNVTLATQNSRGSRIGNN
jgi:hypothetical protein